MQAKAVVTVEPGPIHSWHMGSCTYMCMIVLVLPVSYWQVWSIQVQAKHAHLSQEHAAYPALLLVTSVDCMHLLQSALQPCGSQPCQPRWHIWLVLVAVCRSNMALGTLKVGRWSRKAGGRCNRCSFCVELSMRGKRSLKAGGR